MLNTRTVRHENGSKEIVRVLDNHVWKRWSRANPLAFEKSVVWLQSLEGLDFVRVGVVRNAKSRAGRLLGNGSGVVLGYTKLTGDALKDPNTNGYVRRLFYLKEEDTQLNMNQFPPDAIDPRTILPGVFGQPPNIAELERGYPQYMCRAELGLPIAPEVSPAQSS